MEQKEHNEWQEILVAKVDDEEEAGADIEAAATASWSAIRLGGGDDGEDG